MNIYTLHVYTQQYTSMHVVRKTVLLVFVLVHVGAPTVGPLQCTGSTHTYSDSIL